MAGNLTVETCGNVFAPATRKGSSNYGVGSDGRVGMYVEEKNRAWTSSSPENDNQAVTIEVANCTGAPQWRVSDVALNKTIELCVDICKRNGIEKLNFTGDKTGNLTMHKWFSNTTCPGPYLESKFPYIATEVNKRLSPPKQTTALYKVQVGAFANIENAEKLLLDLKGKGINGVIVESNATPTTEPSLDLGYTKVRFPHNGYFTDVHIYKENKAPQFVLGTPRKYETIQQIASKYLPVKCAVNANLFPFSTADQAKSPLGYGLIVTNNGNGKEIADYYQNSSPNFIDLIAWKDGKVTIETVTSHAVDTKRLANIQGNAFFGASGCYALKIAGNDSKLYWDKVTHANSYTDRTMLGVDADNNWYMIVAECNDNSKGLRALDQLRLCNQLGLTDAVNFDGGKSSVMMVNGKYVTKNTGRKIPAAFICR